MTTRSTPTPTPTTDAGPDREATAQAADRLAQATVTGAPCAPVRDLLGRDDVDAAYAVQRRGIDARVAAGARVVGRKIGLTSPEVQAQLGVDRPDFGVLLDDMVLDDGVAVTASRFLQPRVEAEVAVVLGHDLTEGELDLPQVRSSVGHLVAALEICDSRIEGWDISFADTVADNASAGAVVLGTTRRRLAEVEPREVEMRMSVTGEDDSSGTGEACLGDPLLALRWLARTARELGDPLRAGDLVLTGALGPMRPLAPGAGVSATITGLGAVSCSLVDDVEEGR